MTEFLIRGLHKGTEYNVISISVLYPVVMALLDKVRLNLEFIEAITVEAIRVLGRSASSRALYLLWDKFIVLIVPSFHSS